MNILYCGDKNIERGMMLSLRSIAEHTTEPLHVWALTMTLDTEGRHWEPVGHECVCRTREMLWDYNPGSTVTLFDLTKEFREELPVANLGTHFTPYCMLRLWADRIEGLPDRILYLDNDVLCHRSPDAFYNQSIDDVEMVGVLDHYGRWFFRKHWLRSNYMNSGVLLMNMVKIRETGLLGRCRRQCAEKRMFMPDQTAINDQVRYVRQAPRCYNDQRRQHGNTVFRHFSTTWRLLPWPHTVTVKPWDLERLHSVLRCHEYDYLFMDSTLHHSTNKQV